jgi:hypothetical protein
VAVTLAFTEADIRRAAGDQSFERGLGYLEQVEDLEIASREITATVYGAGTYRVCLTLGEEGLTGDCSCAPGQDGSFCAHCVATGMSVLELGEDLPRRIEATRAQRQELMSWLETLSREDLLAELLALLDEDPDLRLRFELRAALANADTAAVQGAVGELISVQGRGYIDGDEAFEYADDVRQAAAAIGDLVGVGQAQDAIAIARDAIGLLTAAFAAVDDSSGAVADAAQELLDVHLRACESAPPEPAALGDYLAGLLLGDDPGFGPDLDDYADLLGEQGLAAVRERMAAAQR